MIPLLVSAFAHAFPAAPEMGVSQWLSGDPVTQAGEGVVVVELWATWCGPCIEAMPHLSALAEHYNGQIEVAAISDENVRTVRNFLARRDAFAFSTGVDPSGQTTRRFQAIDGATGIPRSYILDGGEVVWSGHPEQIDTVLAAVVGDRWSEGHATRFRELPKMYNSYFADLNGSALGRAATTGAEIVQYGDLYPSMLNNFSWMILTEVSEKKRDLPLALSAAEKSCGLDPESAAFLDTLAVALYQNKRLSEAITVQERAVNMLANEDPVRLELEERLEQFRLEQLRPENNGGTIEGGNLVK